MYNNKFFAIVIANWLACSVAGHRRRNIYSNIFTLRMLPESYQNFLKDMQQINQNLNIGLQKTYQVDSSIFPN